MAEYIERESVIAILEDHPAGSWRGHDVYTDEVRAIMREVEELPAADVAPVRRALLTVSRAMPSIRLGGDLAKIKRYDELFTTFEAVTGMSVSDCLDLFLKGYELVLPAPPPTLSGMEEDKDNNE